ncbi:MAG: ankyrin repeat domain-containing protein, partial [Deltaproteobacteria bacterium]|nr:ankyrin repeat domain-containing protein [Deltaproteobacteria bacterium]
MATLQPRAEDSAQRSQRAPSRRFIAGGVICIAVMLALVSTNATANERCLIPTPEDSDSYPAYKVTVEWIERCLSVGANLEAKTDRYVGGLKEATALHLAARLHPDRAIVEYLVRAGADVHARTADGRTPLHLAVNRAPSDPEMLRFLLDAGVNVNARDNYGNTPLMNAASRDDAARLLRLLLDAGANVHARNDSRSTALHRAAHSSGPEAIRTLLEAGSLANVRNGNGATPLGFAARFNEPQVVDLLLDHGAGPSMPDKEGRFAWDHARLRMAFTGTTTLKRLRPSDVSGGCDLFEPHTIATITVAGLRTCLSNGHDAKRTDPLRRSALHHAAIWNENGAVIETLINAGADPGAKSRSGRTPLHYAAIWNPNTEVLRRLLAHGAPRDATDLKGRTALDYAALRNINPEVAEILLRAGADPQKGYSAQPDLVKWDRDREVAHSHHRAYLEDLIIPVRKHICQLAKKNDFGNLKEFLENVGTRYFGKEITFKEAYPYIYCREMLVGDLDLIRIAVERPHLHKFGLDIFFHFTEMVSERSYLEKILSCKRELGYGCLDIFEHF